MSDTARFKRGLSAEPRGAQPPDDAAHCAHPAAGSAPLRSLVMLAVASVPTRIVRNRCAARDGELAASAQEARLAAEAAKRYGRGVFGFHADCNLCPTTSSVLGFIMRPHRSQT